MLGFYNTRLKLLPPPSWGDKPPGIDKVLGLILSTQYPQRATGKRPPLDSILFRVKPMDLKKKNTILLIILVLAAVTMFFGIMVKMLSG